MEKEKGKQGVKTHLIAVFNFDDLSKVGVFVNTTHVHLALGVDPGNLVKYLDEKINSIGKYVVVRVLRDDKNPIDPLALLEKARPLAETRKGKTVISQFTSENLRYLDSEKIQAIQNILNKKP